MKKIIVILFLFAVSGFARNGSFKSFHGGEKLFSGNYINVSWDNIQGTDTVDIMVWNGSKSRWITIAGNFATNSNFFKWKIPSQLRGDRFRIKVLNSRTKEVYFFSETYFSISSLNFKENDSQESQVENINNIEIFPNPASDKISVKLLNPSNVSNIKIIDLAGNEKMKINYENQYNNLFEFSTLSLESGNYLLVAEVEGTVFSKGFVVLK